MLCGNQRHVGQSENPAALQSKVAGQIGEVFADDVVVSEFFLISLNVFDVNSHSNNFACKKMKPSIRLSVVFGPTKASYLL